ncbi:SDR family oxidoreductase [Pseudonocardia sulfidoxydans NBRC 16205]|uniref:SDR family oxidoreductase n=1 Tax=Pseudonocardia sulfidoxydans NBRC 16205 TaxID=1223511 RepID=A0A511DJ39_9PSEU|nr:SDR family NAD(P)-dependent oxidoreductase [Pseudonocardia sulfidoxydans]GEL23784.1 SDR family oxidoreductase [Pseudonocardia sulfidoxydans NBRC 16205]
MSVALVTGAAGGLGAAVAARLAQDRPVLLTDVDEAGVAEVAAKLAAGGATVAHTACDVRDRASVQSAFEAAGGLGLGEVDAVANVAGVGMFVPFTEVTEEQWDRTFAVNTRGTFLTCQELVRRRAGRPGAVVNIASIGARLGMEMLADYGPSKAAVIELTHVVARVGAPTGLRANTVMPGLIWTDMWRKTSEWLIANDPAHVDSTPEQLFAGFVGAMVPMGRPQTPEDIAETVAFLLSDRAANITGQTVSVDGGVVMT